MRVIEQDSWPRREHFRLYSGLKFPHVNICVQLDVTELWTARAGIGASPTVALVYAVTRAVNRVPELRQRLRDGQVVEYDVVHPQVTVLGNDDLFGLVTLAYDPSFAAFAPRAAECLTRAGENVSLREFPYEQEGRSVRDDLISITILPWLAFTSFAITRDRTESIPVLALGKVQASGDRYRLPFQINFHHALADGLHVARLVEHVEDEARELAAGFE